MVIEDYSARSRMSDVSPRIALASISLFQADELKEMISTATALGVKTSMHLSEDATALFLKESNVVPHTIEHGSHISDQQFLFLRDRGVYWIPTLAVYYTNRAAATERWGKTASTFQRALKIEGLKIACGGDTGTFPHGDNALEMKLMVRLGADWKSVLQWATLSGWECVRGMQWEGQKGRERIERITQLQEDVRLTGDNDVPFGAIKEGFAADIIATRLDLEEDFENAVDPANISFVMKGGKLFKRDGKEVSQ
jgi:imidazolonepropionase-like amidohydrolase